MQREVSGPRIRSAMVRVVAGAALAATAVVACNSIIGFGDYVVSSDGGGGTPNGACDAGAPAAQGEGDFLNACTNAQCVPFDDKARVTRLGDGGALPPVPDIVDGGAG